MTRRHHGLPAALVMVAMLASGLPAPASTKAITLEGAVAVADPVLATPALSSQRASIEFNLERCRKAAQR